MSTADGAAPANRETRTIPDGPRDARWVPGLLIIVAALALLKACGYISAGSGGGLTPGTYGCFSSTITATTRLPRTPDQLVQDTGQNLVRDIVPPDMLLVPAAFGNIVVGAGGDYVLTGLGRGGDHRVNGTELTFTGELAALEVRDFTPDTNRFTLVYDSLAFQCSLNR